MIDEFLAINRDEILACERLRVAKRNAPVATEGELTHGLPVFLDQLREALRRAASQEGVDHAEIDRSAGHHGTELHGRGLTLAQAQIVHGGAAKR